MFLTAANKCFEKLGKYEEEKAKLKIKHLEILNEFKAEQKKIKNRIKIIKNEAFELLSNLTMEKVALTNEIEVLRPKLEKLRLPKELLIKL